MAAGHLDVLDADGGSVAAVHDCEVLFLPLVAQTVGPRREGCRHEVAVCSMNRRGAQKRDDGELYE